MKKILSLFVISILLLFATLGLTACNNQSRLLPFVSELRENVYEGNGETITLKAYYGYREAPFVNDGKIGNCVKTLTFIINECQDMEISYSLELCFLNNTIINFEKTHTGKLKAKIELENLDLSNFEVKVIYSSKKESITLTSILPDKTLTLNDVLINLENNQAELIQHYTSNSTFNGEIYARIIVKNGAPYWYIAFGDGNTLKAFLVDGITGEVLAIREVL